MRVEIQYVKDIFYFTTKGTLFLSHHRSICCCCKHLLKSSFVWLFQIYHVSACAILLLVSNVRAFAERKLLPGIGLLDSFFYSFLSSELNSNTEYYEAPIELVSTQFIYCNFMLTLIHFDYAWKSLAVTTMIVRNVIMLIDRCYCNNN